MIKKFLLASAALAVGLGLIFAALLAWPLPEMPREGVSGNFLIRNVAIVDVETGVLRSNQNVVVRDGKIVSIGSTGISQTDESLILIDGTKQYLMPGLWDMHTHSTKLSSQYQHPLFIANGITGVRDLWGCMSAPDSFFACIEDRRRWNAALFDHSGLSPRYMGQSSYQINGGNEVPEGFPEFFKARNAAEARQLVDYYADAGVGILKPYSELSAEAYTAIAEEARRRGLSLQGHRPLSVSLEAAISAGQASIEHARLFLLECFIGAADFRMLPNPLAAYTHQLRARLVDEHDEERCKTLMTAMANSNTWWTPTLQTLEMGARAGDPSYRDDPRLKYIPHLFEKLMWTPDVDRKVADGADETGRNVHAAMYELALRNVGQAHGAGVKILTGTDTFDTYVFPGFSTHDELVKLVAAGLSPSAALRTATIDAAIFSGVQDDFGSIAIGKNADMILLNANPLLDIHNTQQIEGLFFNGQFYGRSSLDRLLEFAEQRASSIFNNIRILWDAVNSPLLRVQFAD